MPNYFDFEVGLLEVEPRIWRRFLIREGASFEYLHAAIQDACGWWNAHPFVFRTEFGSDEDCEIAGPPGVEYRERPLADAGKVKLASYFGEGRIAKCYYLYDFGDEWWHELILRRTVTVPETFSLELLGGARAFPKEDCGGVSGYQDCVKAVFGEDAGLDDPEGLRRWLGGWHPEAFDFVKAREVFDR